MTARAHPPPLPPTDGHIALLLASDRFDGLIRPSDGHAVAVRAVVRQEGLMAHERRPEIDEQIGVVTIGEPGSQRLVVGIRTVHGSGNISTFGERKDEGKGDASSDSVA